MIFRFLPTLLISVTILLNIDLGLGLFLIDNLSSDEVILCGEHGNLIRLDGDPKSGTSRFVTFFVKVARYNSNVVAEIEGGKGAFQTTRIIGKKLSKGDRFSLEDAKWEIVSLGQPSIFVKNESNNGGGLFYKKYCFSGFVHVKRLN